MVTMKNCTKCGDEKGQLYLCDSCNKELCKKCADLTETEIRCMNLAKRKLKFLCEGCENGLFRIPEFINKLSKLEEKIESIQKTNEELSSKNVTINSEDIIAEMLDRKNRARNIIITNIPEAKSVSYSDKTKEDKDTLTELLKDFEVDTDNIKTYRLGKYNNKARPIKVVLNSEEEAKKILKNRNKVRLTNVHIHGDQTKKQREYFYEVKNNLEELLKKGENNKTIKYIQGKPTIVDKTTVKP